MAIKVYNTLTREKEEFVPVQEGRVGIYLCGPTVYKPSHIGHAVGPVIFDAIRRWLEFRGYKVDMAVNITDVDDKIIAEANQQGKTMTQVAEAVAADYFRAMERLNVRKPTFIPKATEHIPEILSLISRLIDKNVAYVAGHDVYFDVTRFSGYGKLSNRSTEEQEAGTRELKSAEEKRHSWDFALWKGAKPGEPAWESPWGPGRPGWHIECSAMSMKYLGETFDIHGGGMDLIFPHHENEIAQTEAATGKPFVKYWLHNGLTRVNTKKMSKSLGNIRLISDLLDQHSGETIRFFILSTHYRRPIDFSDEEIVR
jgi:cysteinyl-tRNA synthetase